MEGHQFVACDRFTIVDITALVGIDFGSRLADITELLSSPIRAGPGTRRCQSVQAPEREACAGTGRNSAPPSASRASGAYEGKVQQARELLAPVYGWFTEGFLTQVT